MHLARFAPQGRICVYDKRWNAPPRPKAPKGQAYEENLYSFTTTDGILTSTIEDQLLSKIDAAGAREIDALHQTASPISRQDLASYIASLILRSPRAIEVNRLMGTRLFEKMYPRVLRDAGFQERLRKRCKDDNDFRALMEAAAGAPIEMHRDFAMTSHIAVLPQLTGNLMHCECQLLLAKGVEEFIIADSPVFTCNPHSDVRSVAAPGRPGNETTLPLSAQFCLLLRPEGSGRFVRRLISDELVREINNRSAYAARHKFFGSRAQSSWTELAQLSPCNEASINNAEYDNALVFYREIDNQHFTPIA